MNFIKTAFNSIAEWIIIALIAIIAVTAWNNYTNPKQEPKPVYDVYARDNIVQRT